jgi:hypothetical protein
MFEIANTVFAAEEINGDGHGVQDEKQFWDLKSQILNSSSFPYPSEFSLTKCSPIRSA